MCPYSTPPASPLSPASPEHIVHDEKAQLDFSKSMSYGDYLQLDAILSSSIPLTEYPASILLIAHVEVPELWMKLMLHELRAAVAALAADRGMNPLLPGYPRIHQGF